MIFNFLYFRKIKHIHSKKLKPSYLLLYSSSNQFKMYRNINPLVNLHYYYNIAPLYRQLPSFNVVLPENNLENVRSKIVNVMSSVSISCIPLNHHSYNCMAFSHQELVHFNLNIYQIDNNHHMLEFIQLNDVSSFEHILFLISRELEYEIPGSKELHDDNEVDFSTINNTTVYIWNLINSSQRIFQIQGLQKLSAYSRGITVSKNPLANHIFGDDGIWKNIVDKILTLYSINDLELNLIIISTLVEILKVPANWDNKFISSVYKLANHSMMNKNYHMRHEGIMLYLRIYQLIHDGAEDIIEFSNKVRNMDFSNDKPLFDIIKKLLD